MAGVAPDLEPGTTRRDLTEGSPPQSRIEIVHQPQMIGGIDDEDGDCPSPGEAVSLNANILDHNGVRNFRTIGSASTTEVYGKWTTCVLAYQTLGVVWGGLVTSPLYVYPSMHLKSPDEMDYLGMLSIMFWTITLIGVKYICIALRADDHGEGGTFALYSLLCQHVNIGRRFENKCLESDASLAHLSEYKSNRVHSKLVNFLESSVIARRVLLFVAMLGTCMLIGDGILTPAISVLSAMVGLRGAVHSVNQATVVTLSAVVLVMLFLLQRFGTSRVSFLFSPIMAAWLLTTPAVGIYSVIAHYHSIFKAFSPYYILHFFLRNGKEGWLMLGGIVLCITGAEAMFADLGHFSRKSIQMAFLCIVYPSLIFTYAGQTAYLIRNPNDHDDGFYKFIPNAVYWPMFIISTLAAIVASQGLISAAFSVIKQSVALDYFPQIKLVHTSGYKEGQVYCPEVNYILMILCVAVVLGFPSGKQLGNAFGVVVTFVMLITTVLLTFVMLIVWKTSLPVVLVFFSCFSIMEGSYVSAVLTKVPQGGWLPFAISVILAVIMFSWNYGRQKTLEYEMSNKMSLDSLGHLVSCVKNQRVPGLCFFCGDLGNSVSPIVVHYVRNVRSLHEIIIFTTIRYIPVNSVLPNERFLIEGLGLSGVYRCIAQYGYKDSLNAEGGEFMDQVIDCLKSYIKERACKEIDCIVDPSKATLDSQILGEDSVNMVSCPLFDQGEMSKLENSKEAGAVYVVGQTRFKVRKNSGWFNKILLGGMYNFLHRNCRSALSALKIPTPNLVEIGMVYEV